LDKTPRQSSTAQRRSASKRDAHTSRDCPVGPTDAVDAVTGAVACGIKPDGLEVLDQDWEDAFFVEKCPGCVTAVATQS
jgi:hypothetical protein